MTDDHKQAHDSVEPDRLSPGVAARLSKYMHILIQAGKGGCSIISSRALGEHARVNPTQIRRDLAAFGNFGKRGVGYEVEPLIGSIRRIIGASDSRDIALVGAGNLGKAIAGCEIYSEHGLHIVAVFDSDPAKIGIQVGNLIVQPVSEEKTTLTERGIIAGVVAVPAAAAQEAADQLYGAGVRIFINYSGGLIKAPMETIVHDINPAAGLLESLHLCTR